MLKRQGVATAKDENDLTGIWKVFLLVIFIN
jgi:hypothetical protein